MAEAFYPFVDADDTAEGLDNAVRYAARIAVYDDAAAAPRVVIVEPKDVRSYLEEITATVSRLAKEQGGSIPFTVIREIVENLIHAYFAEPAISILDGGDTIRFADQGPGIANKELALEYGTTSATNEMKRYIRGVGSGLPYARQWLSDKGGSLRIEDNMSRGTVVTITLVDGDAKGTIATPPQEVGTVGTSPQPLAWQTAPYPGVPTPYAPVPQQAAYAPMPQQATYVPMAYPQAPAWPQATPAAWPQPPQAPASVSRRGMMALGYLATHESMGPTELVAAFGHSQSTWTRELKALEDAGLVTKRGGQKRFLTPAGQAFLSR